MRRTVLLWLIAVLGVSAAVALVAIMTEPRSRVDFGEWRAVVVHSDDWGFEGWYPTGISDSLRSTLSVGVPQWQAAYLESTLEAASDVEDLAVWFETIRDLDGLPFVLQANTIVAGPSVRDDSRDESWPVHESGAGPDYFRPGLRDAIDAAIARGVWRPELHGLTHYDLHRYAEVRRAGDALALAGAREGAFAYAGYRRDAELDSTDPATARAIAGESVRRFSARFGRPPVSVIAPDYRWGPEDEAAWEALGISVVQARREQVDRAIAPHTRSGRMRKWIRRQVASRFSGLFGVERSVDLEPYGDPDPSAPQGAIAAHLAMESAFREGAPAVLSIHRVQLVSESDSIAEAGRRQLAEVIHLLEESGGARYLVDAEVEQLARRGWSVVRRGDWTVCRNWTDEPVTVELPGQARVTIPARTSVTSGNLHTALQESRN